MCSKVKNIGQDGQDIFHSFHSIRSTSVCIQFHAFHWKLKWISTIHPPSLNHIETMFNVYGREQIQIMETEKSRRRSKEILETEKLLEKKDGVQHVRCGREHPCLLRGTCNPAGWFSTWIFYNLKKKLAGGFDLGHLGGKRHLSHWTHQAPHHGRAGQKG